MRLLTTRSRFLWIIGLLGMAAGFPEVLGQTRLTVEASRERSIGGVTRLDRGRFFSHTENLLPPVNTNLGNLRDLVGSSQGPNVHSGRISTEFDQRIANNLPEDAGRPEFVDPAALRNFLRTNYRNFLLNNGRYAGIRKNSNSFVVNSGRFGAFWPSYFVEPGTGGLPRADAYAEFLSIYLEEVVYGPNAFYPVSPDRFALELVNEPDLHFNATLTRPFLAGWHRDVTQAVLAKHPRATIGGPGLALTGFQQNSSGGPDDFNRFEETLGRMISGRSSSGIGFYSLHPYERYDVTKNNTLVKAVDQSPGRTNGSLDLIRARDLAVNPGQDPLLISLTEYGSFNFLFGDPDAAGYTRAEQQWDLARDIREQLLIYLNRPDVVLNATPFVQGRHYAKAVPTPAKADNVLFEQDARGVWRETIISKTFRMYANVSGTYLAFAIRSEDLQAAAFRDGDEVYVLINNLLGTPQTVDLDVLTPLGRVQSATRDRVFRMGESNLFIDDLDVTGAHESVTLNGDEGTVLTLKLRGDTGITQRAFEQTFYSTDTVLALDQPTGRSAPTTIIADAEGREVQRATLRISYNRPADRLDGEGFRVIFNGRTLDVPAGVRGIDEEDFGIQTREIEVPLDLLVDGTNDLIVDFSDGDGFLVASALTLTTIDVTPGG